MYLRNSVSSKLLIHCLSFSRSHYVPRVYQKIGNVQMLLLFVKKVTGISQKTIDQ